MSDLAPPKDPDGTRAVNLRDALEERYLAYALSTITARSLPDVRDGLKPVHRRLLFAMRQLRLNPADGFKKSARVVGDVMIVNHERNMTRIGRRDEQLPAARAQLSFAEASPTISRVDAAYILFCMTASGKCANRLRSTPSVSSACTTLAM